MKLMKQEGIGEGLQFSIGERKASEKIKPGDENYHRDGNRWLAV